MSFLPGLNPAKIVLKTEFAIVSVKKAICPGLADGLWLYVIRLIWYCRLICLYWCVNFPDDRFGLSWMYPL